MAEPLSLGQLGRVLLRYWILIVVATVLGAGLAFGVTRLMTPVYRATAIQLVKGLPGTGSAATYEAAQYAVSRAKTYPSFVYNSGVLENVRTDLGNTRTPDELRKDLSVANPQNTPLLEISAVASTPEEAQDKANSAARHLARFITEIETVGNRSPISVETAVQAALPTEAAAPKTLVITALGAVIGFALATVAALLNSYVRSQRRSVFRREQAMTWVQSEPATAPVPAWSWKLAAADPAPEPAQPTPVPAWSSKPAAAEPAPEPAQPTPVEVVAAKTTTPTVQAGAVEEPIPGPISAAKVAALHATLAALRATARHDIDGIDDIDDIDSTSDLGVLGLSAAPEPSNNGSSAGRTGSTAQAPLTEPTGVAGAANDAGAADNAEATAEDEDEIPIDGDATRIVTLPAAENVDQVPSTEVDEDGETLEPADDTKERSSR